MPGPVFYAKNVTQMFKNSLSPKKHIFWKDISVNGYTTRRMGKCGVEPTDTMKQVSRKVV